MTTHKFTLPAEIERRETVYEVDVTYSTNRDREIEILSVKSNGVEIATTAREDDVLYDLACARAFRDLAELEEDHAQEYADMIRDFQRDGGCDAL